MTAPVIIIEITQSEVDGCWRFKTKGGPDVYSGGWDDAEEAEQGALDELGSGRVAGFVYPDQGDTVYPVPGKPPKPDLAAQEKRIWAVGRLIYTLPREFRLAYGVTILSLRDLLDNALTSNIVYGDYQMAEGYLATLTSRIEAAERVT